MISGKAQTSFGRPLTLEFRRAGATRFEVVGRTRVGQGDRFTVRGKVPGAGAVRVAVTPNGIRHVVRSRQVGVRVVRELKVGGRRLHVVAGRAAIVKGRGAPGEPVRLQVWRSGGWATVARTRPGRHGRFAVRYRGRTPMSASARVVAGGLTRAVGRLNVYRSAQASWYGPGLYGGQLACGGTLTPGTVGVANKSLPCGTKVTLRHGRRSLRVEVIDRGPYVGGREYDLTAATADRLGYSGAGSILTTR